MLNQDMIKSVIQAAAELKKVKLEKLGTEAYVKKFTRKDTKLFNQPDVDALSAMIFVGIVDEKGERVFESLEQVEAMPDSHLGEMFLAVNEYNSVKAEDQAKK